MNTKLIKYAVELANYGSYQKVANKHQISRSAVSRNIKRLEEDFGCTLFMKLQDNIVPTCNGDVFLRYARQILNIEDDLRYSIGKEGAYRGNVSVGMGTNRAAMFISNILPDFIEEYPNIAVNVKEMNSTEIVNSIISRQIDFGVVSTTVKSSGLDYEPLLDEELVIVPPGNDTYALEHSIKRGNRRYVRIEDFDGKMFVSGHSGQQSTAIADHLFKYAGISPKIVFRTENCISRSLMAKNSGCYALIPHSYTHVSGIVTPHYHIDSDADLSWKIGIVHVASSEMTKVAATLKLFILDKMKR